MALPVGVYANWTAQQWEDARKNNPQIYNYAVAHGWDIPGGAVSSSLPQNIQQQQLWNSKGFTDYLSSNNLKNPFNINSSNPYERQKATEWLQNAEKNFIANSDKPGKPAFQSAIDPKTGKLKKELLLNPFTIGSYYDPSGLAAFEKEALRTGPSAWANLMKDRQMMDEQDLLNATIAQAQGASSAAMDELAMRGGLSSGARERGAENLSRSINRGTQGTRREGMRTRLGIDVSDEEKRMQALSQLPGMQLQKSQYLSDIDKYNSQAKTDASKYNIGNTLSDLFQQRAYDLGTYNEAMKAWAANKQGDAMASSGGGGCFITTAVCEYLGLLDDNPILNEFRKFRDEHLGGKDSKKIEIYYTIAPKIVEKIKNDLDELNRIICVYLMPAFLELKKKDFEKAEKIYTDMVVELQLKHLKED